MDDINLDTSYGNKALNGCILSTSCQIFNLPRNNKTADSIGKFQILQNLFQKNTL